MRVESALLCDAATIREGLLHVLGAGVTRVGRPMFPTTLGIALAVVIAVEADEAGEHRLDVHLVERPDTRVAGLAVEFAVASPAGEEPEDWVSVPVVLPADQMPLPRPARYEMRVLIDDEQLAALRFEAAVHEAAPPA